jgi:hypothetical protein
MLSLYIKTSVFLPFDWFLLCGRVWGEEQKKNSEILCGVLNPKFTKNVFFEKYLVSTFFKKCGGVYDSAL